MRDRLSNPSIGPIEKAVCEAQAETLRWVVNKEGFSPDSQATDAMIEDYYNANPDQRP